MFSCDIFSIFILSLKNWFNNLKLSKQKDIPGVQTFHLHRCDCQKKTKGTQCLESLMSWVPVKWKQSRKRNSFLQQINHFHSNIFSHFNLWFIVAWILIDKLVLKIITSIPQLTATDVLSPIYNSHFSEWGSKTNVMCEKMVNRLCQKITENSSSIKLPFILLL